MKISIITPTLQRESLRRCCESVNSQSGPEWEHLVFIDAPEINSDLISGLYNPKRTFLSHGKHYANFGNTPRHEAWKEATGDYVLYCDDDNYLAHPYVLEDIANALEKHGRPAWAIFPIMRFGGIFFTPDPRSCHVDTANMVIRKDIAQWPDGAEYTMDGIFCDYLKSRYPFAAIPNVRPIIVMDQMGRGQ